MKRRLFNLLAAGSLVLMVLFLVGWVLTYRFRASASMAKALRKTDVWVVDTVSLNLGEGEITVMHQRFPDLSPREWSPRQRRWECSRGTGEAQDFVLPPGCTYPTSPIWERWGFFKRAAGSFAETSDFGSSGMGVPLWLPTGVCLVPPVLFLRSRLRTLRRARLGLCVNCGFDLRASKERCPECGTAIPADQRKEFLATDEHR